MRANPDEPRLIAADGTWDGALCGAEDGCGDPVHCLGLCKSHYDRLSRTGTTREPVLLTPAKCSVKGCPGRPIGWELCPEHYRVWRWTGDPLASLPPAWIARYWAKVDRRSDDDCWPWLGAFNTETGYGYFNQEGRTRLAHQVAYEVGVGPIPPGLEPDHLCRNRPCVNWHHLEAVTHRENVLRSNGIAAQYARREACPNDHDYTPKNTVWTTSGRRCLICLTAKQERRNETKREARKRRI